MVTVWFVEKKKDGRRLQTIKEEEMSPKGRITVSVRLFAAPREFLGKSEINVSLPCEATLTDLITCLSTEYPKLAKYLPYSKLAINHKLSAAQAPLHDGDTIALLPPVGGG